MLEKKISITGDEHKKLRATASALRKSTPSGYNLAVFAPLNHDIKDMGIFDQATVILDCCDGPLGILRGLEIRMPGIQTELAESGERHRLLHLIFEKDGSNCIKDYRFVLAATNNDDDRALPVY